MPPATRDSDWATLKHPERAWGEGWRGRHLTTARPWPTSSLAHLLWLAETDAEPWLPTTDEMDAHIIEATAEDGPGLGPPG